MIKTRQVISLGLAIILAISICLLFGCSDNEPTTPVPSTPTPTESPTPVPTTSVPTESPTAEQPVEIVIYTDFKCSVCARLHFEVETELMKRYVNTGQAQMKFYIIAALGPESVNAARATFCAAEQGKFWEYRDAILTAWREQGDSAYSDEQLRNTARELGLDEAAFDACLNNPAILEKLEQNLQKSREDGVNEVPIVFINGNKVVGVKPLETYIDLIEEQLAARESQ